MKFSRRGFLASSAAALGSLALGSCDTSPIDPGGITPLPDPESSGIEHVILVMMENRSFDHFLGWLPGADGQQAGLTYRDSAGIVQPTFQLAPDFQGCGYRDPDHSYTSARVQYNGGACDGWLQANDRYSIGYYRREDLPFFGQAVNDWTAFDRYFGSFMGPTYPNRFYQHAAQTDRLQNSQNVSTLPTIWDRLADRGVAARYYYSDLPFLALWGSKYGSISDTFDAFVTACAAGTLPSVAFLEPPFLGEETGTGADDHPHNDVRAGETFLNRVYSAVTTGPGWAHTVLIINFDEWGGFFDHVAPPAAPIPYADRMAGSSDGLRGFRTPMMLISPFARRGHTSHVIYDHTSVLRLIEWRWDLPALTIRDSTANNLAIELDFAGPNLDAPAYAVPSVVSTACPTGTPPTAPAHWVCLKDLARRFGWL